MDLWSNGGASRHSPRRRCSLASVAPPAALLLLLCSTVLLNHLTLTESLATSDDRSAATPAPCDLTYCWELYQSAQEALRVPDDLGGASRGRQRSSTSTGSSGGGGNTTSVLCVASRTFYQCLRAMGRACLGNLNYHSSHRGIEKQMKGADCSVEGPVFVHIGPAVSVTPEAGKCAYPAGVPSKHCSMYPHLRTFGDAHEICRLEGAWPLVENEHLTVQVTSEWVGASLHATAISKVTVVVKHHEDCALEHFVTYQASSSFELPSAFDDGQTTVGTSVSLEELTPGVHVRIALRYVGTSVEIRQSGAFLSVLVSVPDAVLNETHRRAGASPLQLCAARCPRRLRVDVAKFFAGGGGGGAKPHLAVSDVESALAACRRRGLVDGYLDSCVYDFAVTGNRDLLALAGFACDDAVRLRLTRSNRTTLISVASRALRMYCDAWCLCATLVSMLLAARICYKDYIHGFR